VYSPFILLNLAIGCSHCFWLVNHGSDEVSFGGTTQSAGMECLQFFMGIFGTHTQKGRVPGDSH